ncbi:hypothetical protein [Microbulbifer sp.]|nr:hypothetical protein [Microbulbifer sp.]
MATQSKFDDTPEDVLDTASAGDGFYVDPMSCNLTRMKAQVHM